MINNKTMKKQYTQAAVDLASNPSYKLLKEALMQDLSSNVSLIASESDNIVSRAYVHDVGVRNFFRWVDQAAANTDSQELSQTLKPFNHYGEFE